MKTYSLEEVADLIRKDIAKDIVEAIEEDFKELRARTEGWGENGDEKPYTPAFLDMAEAALAKICQTVPPPFLYGTTTDFLSLEWEGAVYNVDLHVTYNTNKNSIHYEMYALNPAKNYAGVAVDTEHVDELIPLIEHYLDDGSANA